MRTAALITALAAASSAAAVCDNLLDNGDLELSLGGPDSAAAWTLTEPSLGGDGVPADSAAFASFANHTPGGDRGLWLKPWAGGFAGPIVPVDATLHQDAIAFPGVEYTLSAWFKFEPNYTSEATTLSIEFLGPDGAVLSAAAVDVNQINANDAVWREFSVVGVAGPGTTAARARIDMAGGVPSPVNPQSALVDDIVLTNDLFPCKYDLDCDGVVGGQDLNILLAAYGDFGFGLLADVNDDLVVNSADLNLLLSNFGCGTP